MFRTLAASTVTAVEPWRARLPIGEKDLYVPGRLGPKMFIACRCTRCGTPFTIWKSMEYAIRRLVKPGTSWPPARVSRFCSEDCGSSATPPRRRARVLVAGRCRHPQCGMWFTAPVPATRAGAASPLIPAYCSTACKDQDLNRAKKQRLRVNTAARKGQSVSAAAIARMAAVGRRGMCPACWQRQVSAGSFQRVLCPTCMTTVESSCRRKARRGTPRNAERVAAARSSWRGRDLATYRCELCGWWHVGGGVSARRAKQVAFTVHTFVAAAPAELVERLRVEYAPSRANAKGPRVRGIR